MSHLIIFCVSSQPRSIGHGELASAGQPAHGPSDVRHIDIDACRRHGARLFGIPYVGHRQVVRLASKPNHLDLLLKSLADVSAPL